MAICLSDFYVVVFLFFSVADCVTINYCLLLSFLEIFSESVLNFFVKRKSEKLNKIEMTDPLYNKAINNVNKNKYIINDVIMNDAQRNERKHIFSLMRTEVERFHFLLFVVWNLGFFTL